MKQRYVLIILSALALSACAGAPQSRTSSDIDSEYMGAVERSARSGGVQVQWVNPPRRKRDTEEQG